MSFLVYLATFVLFLFSFQSSVPCYSELFRVMEEKEHAKGTDLVICSEDGGEYTRFPLPVSI